MMQPAENRSRADTSGGAGSMRAIARLSAGWKNDLDWQNDADLAVESWGTRDLRMRLEAARLRCRLPPISPERQAELKGRTIVGILHSGRRRAAARKRELGTIVP